MKQPFSIADSLWLDANVATLQPGMPYGIIKDAAIAITKGKISWIGPRNNLPCPLEQFAKQCFSAKGQWVTPGLIDCHTHIVYGGNRAHEFAMRLHGASYEEIAKAGGGIRSTVVQTRNLNEEQLFQQAAVRLKALMAEGVTTIEIKSGYGLDLATELKILRVARQLGKSFPVLVQTTFLGAHTVPVEYAGKPDAYIDFLCETVLPAAHAEKLVDAVDAFCETIGFTVAQTEKMFQAAKRLNLPIKLHAEQLSEMGGTLLAAKYKALSADHLENATEKSIAAMAEAGMTAVLLPGAFYFLRETCKPPIDLMRKYRVPMALATDCNPGTSPVTSLLLILNMACTLFKLTPEEAFTGITRHAAEALGLAQTHGTLEVGKVADLVVWDINHPDELAYQIGFNPMTVVIKAGKPIRNNNDEKFSAF